MNSLTMGFTGSSRIDHGGTKGKFEGSTNLKPIILPSFSSWIQTIRLSYNERLLTFSLNEDVIPGLAIFIYRGSLRNGMLTDYLDANQAIRILSQEIHHLFLDLRAIINQKLGFDSFV